MHSSLNYLIIFSQRPTNLQQAQQGVFEETNVFTSFAVPPEDEDLPYSYLPVPSMDFLKQELQDKIKVNLYLSIQFKRFKLFVDNGKGWCVGLVEDQILTVQWWFCLVYAP